MRFGVHAVFHYERHGNIIPVAGISTDVTNHDPMKPVVPHMVRLPSQKYLTDFSIHKGMRSELGME